MDSRGRGLAGGRSNRRKRGGAGHNDESTATTTTAKSSAVGASAWADFLREEADGNAAAATTTTTTETTKNNNSNNNNNKQHQNNKNDGITATNKYSSSSSSSSNGDHGANNNNARKSNRRIYRLPLLPEWKQQHPSSSNAASSSSSSSASSAETKPPARKRSKRSSSSTESASTSAGTSSSTAGSIISCRPGGVLVQTGSLDSPMIGRTKRFPLDKPYDLWVPTRLLDTLNTSSPLASIQVTRVVASCNACHALCLDQQGIAYGWGRNDSHQLTKSLPVHVVKPTKLELPPSSAGSSSSSSSSSSAPHVVHAAVGKWHSVLLEGHTGQLYAVGGHKLGQCAVGGGGASNASSSNNTIPNFRKCAVAIGGGTGGHVKFVQVACGEATTMAISEDGELYTAGSAEYGQLGNGETGEYIVTAGRTAFGNSHQLVRRTQYVHTPATSSGSNASSSSSGGAGGGGGGGGGSTRGDDSKNLKRVPLSAYDGDDDDDDDDGGGGGGGDGHDGNNKDGNGKGKGRFRPVKIAHIACGKYHAVAIEAPSENDGIRLAPRVFSWGCGNYGCLGHGIQADEYKPRLIAALDAAVSSSSSSSSSVWVTNPPVAASCGSSCTLVRTKSGHVYYFGKHRSGGGEATMRPSILAELAHNGHVVSHVSAGSQTVVCSTANAVTVCWGQGPYGELGLGHNKKSCAKPQFVPTLEACRVQSLACGYGNTYYVLQREDAEDEKAIASLPVVSSRTYAELAGEEHIDDDDDQEEEEEEEKQDDDKSNKEEEEEGDDDDDDDDDDGEEDSGGDDDDE